MKGKSCLTNLIAFYDKMSSSVGRGRAIDTVYLDFKAFDTVSHNTDKLLKYSLVDSKLDSKLAELPGSGL